MPRSRTALEGVSPGKSPFGNEVYDVCWSMCAVGRLRWVSRWGVAAFIISAPCGDATSFGVCRMEDMPCQTSG